MGRNADKDFNFVEQKEEFWNKKVREVNEKVLEKTGKDLKDFSEEIKRFFYEEGLGIPEIALKLGLKENCGDKDKTIIKDVYNVIALEVLGFKSLVKYREKHEESKKEKEGSKKGRSREGIDINSRLEAKERDGYSCCRCGSNSDLGVYFKDLGENEGFGKQEDVDSVITLCGKCFNRLKRLQNLTGESGKKEKT